MNIRMFIGFVAAFSAGIAVGHFVLGSDAADTGEAFAADRQIVESNEAAADVSAELKAAREKIQLLEQRIASLSARPKKPVKEKSGDDDSVIVIDGTTTNLDDVLAKKLSAEDLQKVKDVFERMRRARAKRAQSKREFLASIDMSGASPEEQKTHENFMKLVAKQEKLMGKAKGLIPDQKTVEQLAMLQMKSKPLAEAERKTLLRQMSANLGYAGDDADVVVGTIEDIVGATSAGGVGEMLNSIMDSFGGMME